MRIAIQIISADQIKFANTENVFKLNAGQTVSVSLGKNASGDAANVTLGPTAVGKIQIASRATAVGQDIASAGSVLPALSQITEHLRACANCGRGTFLRTSRIDLFCDPCWITLFHNSQVTFPPEYPFKVCSLLVWTQFSPQVASLIYSLKLGGLISAYERLAEHFLFSLSSQNYAFPNDALIICPPGRFEKDHAYRWGEALAKASGYEFASPFEFATRETASIEASEARQEVPPSEQKRLRKKDRFTRQFELNAEPNHLKRPIIFVDDLITTGATAVAAYKALNSPRDFEVWAIARRPKLAGDLGI